MKKTSISKRIFSAVLALILSFSGINFDSLKVYAANTEETLDVTGNEKEESETALEAADNTKEETPEDLGEEMETMADTVDVTVKLEFPKESVMESIGDDNKITVYFYKDGGYSSNSEKLILDKVQALDTKDGKYVVTCPAAIRLEPAKYKVAYYIESKVNTNLCKDTTYYLTETGFSTKKDEGALIEINDSVTIPLFMADLWGKVSLPEDYFSDNEEGTVSVYMYAKADGKEYSSSYSLSEDTRETYYQFKNLPTGVTKLDYVYAKVSAYNMVHNLATDNKEYICVGEREKNTEEGVVKEKYGYISAAENDDSKIDLEALSSYSKTGLFDIELLKAKVSYSISLPEEAILEKNEEISGSVYAYYGTGNSYRNVGFSIPSGEKEAYIYLNSFPLTAEKLYGTKINISSSNNYADNIAKGEFYLNDGKLIKDKTMTEKAFNEDGTVEESIKLRSAIVKVTVRLADNAKVADNKSYVEGWIYFNDGKNGNQNNYFKFSKDKREHTVYLTNLDPDADSLNKVYLNMKDTGANMSDSVDEYYNGTDTLVSKNPSYTLDLSENNVTSIVMTPWVAPATVTVKIPEDAIVPEGVNVKGTIYAYYNGGNKTKSFTIKSGEDSVTIPLNNLPGDVTELSYIYVNLDTIKGTTDLVYNMNEYYKSATETVSDKKEASAITDLSAPIEITLAKTPAHFKMSLGEGVFFKGAPLKGYFYVNAGNSWYSTAIEMTEGTSSLGFYINSYPWDKTEIQKTYVNWKQAGKLISNIQTEANLYYNGSKFAGSGAVSYTYDIAGIVKEFTVEKCNSLVPVKIKLPEGSAVYGEDLTGTVYVCHVSETSTDRKSAKFVISEGETECITYVIIPDNYSPDKIYGIYYNVDDLNKVGSDVSTGKDYWYDGSDYSTSRVMHTFENISEENPVVLPLKKGKSLGGTIHLPEGAYVKNNPCTGYVEVRFRDTVNEKETTKKYYFNIPVDAAEVPYIMTVPEGYDLAKYILVRITNSDSSTVNLYTNSDMYLGEEGIVNKADNAKSIELSDDKTIQDLTILRFGGIKGRVHFPVDYYLTDAPDTDSDATLYIYAYYNNTWSTKSTTVKLNAADLKDSYDFYLPINDQSAEKITRVRVKLSKDNNSNTDLAVDDYFYLTEENEMLLGEYDLTGYTLSSGETYDFEFTLKTVPVLKGKIKLPEDAVIGNNTPTVKVCATCLGEGLGSYGKGVDSANITIAENESGEYEYALPLKYGTGSIKNLYAYVGNVGDSNLSSGYCYRINDNVSSKNSDNSEIELTDDLTCDITLLTKNYVSGTLTLPDSVTLSGGTLYADIYCYNENGYKDGSAITLAFDSEKKTAEFKGMLPVESKKFAYFTISFRVANSKTKTSALLNKTLYVGADGVWRSSTNGIEAIDVSELSRTIKLLYPEPKTITGSISVDEIGYIQNGSLKVTLAAFTDADGNNSSGSVTKVTLNDSEDVIEYAINLPLLATTVNYIEVSGSFTGKKADCNIKAAKEKCYQGLDNGLRKEALLCTPIPLENNTASKDIVLEGTRTVTGNILLPEGATIGEGVHGVLAFTVGGFAENYEFDITSLTDEIPYEVELPSGAENIEKVSVTLSGSAESNLVMGTMYYSSEKEKWVTSELDAKGFATNGVTTEFDVMLSRKITLAGTVKLGDGAYFDKASLNGYVKADVGNASAISYFEMKQGETSAVYEMNIPAEADTIDNIQIFVYANSLLDSNILTGQIMYLTENGWDMGSDNAISIDREGKFEIKKDLSLPLSCIFTGTISRSDVGEALEGSVSIHNSGSEYVTTFSLAADEYSTTYRISLPHNADLSYKLSYDISTQYIEDYCSDEVYVNPDGTYSLTASLVETETMKQGSNIRDFKIAGWDDLKEDVLLESPHPYESDGSYTMHYEYPGTADGLKITFSDNTHFEQGFDDFYLLDEDKNILLSFTGDEAAGKTVTIPVTKVDFVIDADVSNPSYGFGIVSIEAVNGVPDSELATSIIYENDIATKAVIHKSSEENSTFYMSAADYNEEGKMISSSNKKVTIKEGISVVSLNLPPNENSALGKLMLYDKNLVPLKEATFKIYAAYTVTYHYNDAVNTTRVLYVTENKPVSRPGIEPSKEGYSFKGWFTDSDCETEYTFGEYVTSDVHVYAGWNKLYEVTAKTVGGGTVASSGLKGIYGNPGDQVALYPEDVSGNEDLDFMGWTIESGLDEGEYEATEDTLLFTMPSKDVSVIATFKTAVDITWIETNIEVDNEEHGKESLLPTDHKLIVPSKYSSIDLKGMVPLTTPNLKGVSYIYKYFTENDEGQEIYTEDPEKNIDYDTEGIFEIKDLPISAGSNTLSVIFTYDDDSKTTVDYIFTGVSDNIKLSDEVTEMDLYDLTDMAFVDDLATGIEAYWNTEDGFTVLIINKESEIAKRALSEEDEEGHIGIGSIWIIPCCEEFPTGYTFKIMDIGNSEYAPEPMAGDAYEGMIFSSEKYMYILAGIPDISEILDDSCSLEMTGIDGIAFTLLPENSVMNFDLEQEDGSSVMATSGSLSSPGEVTRKGFQFQNLARNIIPKASVKSNKVGISLEFADTVLYDNDGSKNTTWDQLSLGGSLNIKDLGVEGAWEWHPSVCLNPWSDDFGLNILPQQMGLLLDYTLTQTVKVQIGGTLGGDRDLAEGDRNNAWSLSEIIKAFNKQFGTGADNKKSLEFLGFNAEINGVDMGSSIILAAVGLNISTMTPTAGTYGTVSAMSTAAGFSPVLCFMVVMDVNGSISGKFTYQYAKTSYHASGFNITKEGFSETNAKIKRQTPVYETKVCDYNVEVFNTCQASESDRSEAVGKHTISVNAEAKFNFDFGVGLAFLLCGLNVAQVKGGLYADATAGAVGSVVLQKGSQPEFNLDGYVNTALGLVLMFNSTLFAKTFAGDVGWDVSFDKKWELASWGISSLGISGTVSTPSLMENVSDPGLEGVEVILKPFNPVSDPISTVTDANGKYSFKNLTPNTSYTVELKKPGYVQKKEVTADTRIDVSTTSVKKKNFSMARSLYLGIEGTIEDAETGDKISGANITLTNLSNSSVRYSLTKSDGTYTVGKVSSSTEGLTPGYYKMVVSAKGYKTVSKKILVNAEEEKVVQIDKVMMLKGSGDEDCVITGYIYDLATGKSTGAPLKLYLRSGLDNTTGRILKTFTLGTDGKYEFNVPVGNYTIEVKDTRFFISDDEKYIKTHFNAIAATNTFEQEQNGYVSTNSSSDQVRIVLTWGEKPSDLDSHLVGPDGKGTGKFHTYYSNKRYVYKNTKYDDLDLDDITSYGPETTTIYKKTLSGNYSFYVHDYSNRSSTNSMQMSLSDATVKVYIGSRLMATYRVPKNRIGTVWHVFDYNPMTNALIEKGKMYNVNNPGDVGFTTASTVSGTDMELYDGMTEEEANDISIILEDMEEKD